MKRFPLPRMSYAFVVSTTAIAVAISGTAWAAVTITGSAVKNGTLLSTDIKNGSLNGLTLSSTVKTTLSKPGPKGPDGPQGITGPRGDVGPVGDKGTPAKNAYAWAYNTCEQALTEDTSPNINVYDWSNLSWGHVGSCTGWRNPNAVFGDTNLTLASGVNDGLVVLEWPSDVIAVAHLVLVHWDAVAHTRVECQLKLTDIDTNATSVIGTPVLVSSGTATQVMNLGLVGGFHRAAGKYSIKVECRDPDIGNASYQRWTTVKGNLSVVSARDWR